MIDSKKTGRDMVVEGVIVPFEALEKAFTIHLGHKFTFSDMSLALVKCGVDRYTAYRAADRLLQSKRRAGLISFGNKAWWKSA